MRTSDPVPLDRNFSAIPRTAQASDEQDLLAAWGYPPFKQWTEIEEGYRTVILGEAGTGKTFEMLARAQYLSKQERLAFFIRIEDIDTDFEHAFEIGCAKSFKQWLGSKEEAWFFLDSVDEARLTSPTDFRKAIRRFSNRIGNAQTRAHILISSRPSAWHPQSDRDLVEQRLPFEKSQEERKGETPAPAASAEPSDHELKIYRLRSFDDDQIRQFTAHRSTPDVDDLINELKRLDLLEVARRPFDLEAILDKWKSERRLGTRHELLRHNIETRLKEADPDRDSRQPLDLDKAREGARMLAAAVILTGEAGIRVPENTHEQTGIDARSVLTGWGAREIETLLGRPVFDGVIYGTVRFHNRQVPELLAAEWFCELLRNGNARHAIEGLIFREQYGEQFIAPRLRPVVPWLMLDDENIHRRAMAIDPAIAVQGGDPARLPLQVRRKILVEVVEQIVQEKETGPVHDNNAIALIAQTDLTEETLALINRYADNDDVIFFLGRLVWQGKMSECVPPFLDIAADPDRGIYARIAATRAVVTCGTTKQQRELWSALLTAHDELPQELFMELVEGAIADSRSVQLILESIDKLPAYRPSRTSGLRRTFHGFIRRLPCPHEAATDQPLAELVKGIGAVLDRPPHIERRYCHISEEFAWLLDPAIHAVERLVSARSEAAMEDHAIAIMLKNPIALSWPVRDVGDYKHCLGELVPDWPELNEALFWQTVQAARPRLEQDGRVLDDILHVQYPRPDWSFGPETLPRVLGWTKASAREDDRLVALSVAFGIYAEARRSAESLVQLREAVTGDAALEARLEQLLNPAVPGAELERQTRRLERKREQEEHDREREQIRTDQIAQLKENPDLVRNPPGLQTGELSKAQYWLYREVEGDGERTNRAEGANWESLSDEFGMEVAIAYRDAAMKHWRQYKPGLRSENQGIPPEGSSGIVISYSLLFAMAGLEIESREAKGFPEHLSESEVRHALRYITWELNGFPSWLEVMYRTHPQVVADAVQTELFWEVTNTQPGQPMHYILDDLNHAPWLHAAIAEPLLKWMRSHDVPSCEALSGSLSILRGSSVDPAELTGIARSKVAAGPPSEHLPYWYALWVDAEPETGITAVKHWLNGFDSSEESSNAAQLFISILIGTLGGRNTGPHVDNFRTAEHLKALYVLMHRHIRADEDIDRSGGEVYTPGLRDNAQNARDALFRFLSEIPGKQTYVAITALAREHPNPDSRIWMKKHAFERAEQDGDLEPWTPEQVHEFYSNLTRPLSTHHQLFELTTNRLTDLKNWIEHGVYSPYVTWRKTESESELRNLVAGWLNHNWGNSVTVAQEPELANRQRMDIWVQNPTVDSPVPIELKILDKGWTGPQLCKSLRDQLASDYLRHAQEGCGVMLLVWLGTENPRKWRIDGKLVGISKLQQALKDYWDGIAHEFSKVAAIEIILIDMSAREASSDD